MCIIGQSKGRNVEGGMENAESGSWILEENEDKRASSVWKIQGGFGVYNFFTCLFSRRACREVTKSLQNTARR